jgi:hypothetical protein
MSKLIKYIKSVEDEHAEALGLDMSRFYVAEDLIPEVVVDRLKALVFSHDTPSPFYTYEGRFTCPSFLKKDKVLDDEESDSDSDSTEHNESPPKRKNSCDMDLEEEPEEVDAFECAYRLTYYFRADGFTTYFVKDE